MAGMIEFFDWFLSCRFINDLIAALSSYWSAEAPEEVGCSSLEENSGLPLISNFLFLDLVCLEKMDQIYVILGRSIMFTILKGLEIFYGPSISQESL